MRHMVLGPNVALLTHRPQSPRAFTYAFCTRLIGDQCVAANKVTGGGNSFEFPLYLYEDGQALSRLIGGQAGGDAPPRRSPNLAPEFTADISRRVRMTYVSDGIGDLQTTFGPEDVFHYIYAVFHAPTYRSRYAEFLKADFPRVPLTSDPDVFRRLCALGAELTALHLLESRLVADPAISYPMPGDNTVARGFPRYVPPGEPELGTGAPIQEGRVYINQRQYFDPVEPDVWGFHVGGYQVCEKWLKDRRGRRLSYNDLLHYKQIVLALRETIRLMREIDEAIPEWPIA